MISVFTQQKQQVEQTYGEQLSQLQKLQQGAEKSLRSQARQQISSLESQKQQVLAEVYKQEELSIRQQAIGGVYTPLTETKKGIESKAAGLQETVQTGLERGLKDIEEQVKEGQASLSKWKQEATAGVEKAEAEWKASNTELDSGEWVPKAEFEALPPGYQTRLKQLGVDQFNKEVEAEQRKFEAATGELEPFKTDEEKYNLTAAIDKGVSEQTLLVLFTPEQVNAAKEALAEAPSTTEDALVQAGVDPTTVVNASYDPTTGELTYTPLLTAESALAALQSEGKIPKTITASNITSFNPTTGELTYSVEPEFKSGEEAFQALQASGDIPTDATYLGYDEETNEVSYTQTPTEEDWRKLFFKQPSNIQQSYIFRLAPYLGTRYWYQLSDKEKVQVLKEFSQEFGYFDWLLSLSKVEQEDYAKDFVKQAAISLVPVYGTVRYWDEMSPAQKAISIVGDIVFIALLTYGIHKIGILKGVKPSMKGLLTDERGAIGRTTVQVAEKALTREQYERFAQSLANMPKLADPAKIAELLKSMPPKTTPVVPRVTTTNIAWRPPHIQQTFAPTLSRTGFTYNAWTGLYEPVRTAAQAIELVPTQLGLTQIANTWKVIGAAGIAKAATSAARVVPIIETITTPALEKVSSLGIVAYKVYTPELAAPIVVPVQHREITLIPELQREIATMSARMTRTQVLQQLGVEEISELADQTWLTPYEAAAQLTAAQIAQQAISKALTAQQTLTQAQQAAKEAVNTSPLIRELVSPMTQTQVKALIETAVQTATATTTEAQTLVGAKAIPGKAKKVGKKKVMRPPPSDEEREEEETTVLTVPDGTWAWKQGFGWRWYPPPYDAKKPYFSFYPPAGAKNTHLKTPEETIQIIGEPANVPDQVGIDLGVVDILLLKSPKPTIAFKGKGLITVVGNRIPSTTHGLGVPAKWNGKLPGLPAIKLPSPKLEAIRLPSGPFEVEAPIDATSQEIDEDKESQPGLAEVK